MEKSMRLWTLHPQYLDTKGLLALWREALLAQKVLSGATRGYRNHPQLIRFIATGKPLEAINTFLVEVWREAGRRGYNFDKNKVKQTLTTLKIDETAGQLAYEWRLLKSKLERRAPEKLAQINLEKTPRPHPMFRIVAGEVQSWERVKVGV